MSVNFLPAELDTVIVKEYKAWSGFTVFIDSQVFTPVMDTMRIGDTLYARLAGLIYYADLVGGTVDTAALLVYLPDDSLTFKVTNITFKEVTVYCDPCGGRMPTIAYQLNSYYVNGVKCGPGEHSSINIYK